MTADPYADDFGDDEDDEKVSSGKATVAELEKERNRLGKALRDEQKKVRELEAFRVEIEAERRTSSIADVFTKAGANPKHANLYAKLNPDVDPASLGSEAVTTWLTENDLPVPEATSEAIQEVKEPGFVPAPTSQATASKGVLSREDWNKLLVTDPAAAQEAFLAKRVDLSDVEALRSSHHGPKET